MLARMQKALKEKDQGFTLIELLVVIVIIGVLAAIAIPLFLNQQKKGVDAGLKSDVKNAATTVQTWLVDNPTTAITTSNAATVLADFEASDGNTVTVQQGSGVGTYCIQAINSGSSDGDSYIVYDSEAGGLQDGFDANGCTADAG